MGTIINNLKDKPTLKNYLQPNKGLLMSFLYKELTNQ